jgi:radical SAM superfamily enzyme YgiQ (UPF0313 family)
MDIYPLLGHGYLASYLERDGYGVELVDTTFEDGPASYLDALDVVRPKLVGIYGHLVSRANAFNFAKMAKARGLVTIGGGPDATGYYQEYLDNGFDVVVRSEGEVTASELMQWHKSGASPNELKKIQGIAYRDGERIVVTDLRPFITDVDSLPFPRRDRHIYQPYVDAWMRHHGYVSMALFAARGCPYDCAFCYRPVFGRNYRRRSPENIVAEIEKCAHEFGANHFRFVDDTFVVHRPWVRELSGLIGKLGLKVSFDVLARTNLIDDETAADLRSMGVRRIYFGMESGSDRVLQEMSKRATVADAIRAGEIVRKHGMEFLSWIMLGYPEEEKSDIQMTRDMLVKVKPDILSISVAFPIRGTAFHDQVKDRISSRHSLWKRTGENRMVWQGRYPDIFYSFARRWLSAEVELAKGTYQGMTRVWRTVLKWGYRVGMEISSFSLRRGNGRSERPSERPSERGARRLPTTPVQNLSNRIHGGNPYS